LIKKNVQNAVYAVKNADLTPLQKILKLTPFPAKAAAFAQSSAPLTL